jgi:hypothetical protein
MRYSIEVQKDNPWRGIFLILLVVCVCLRFLVH